MKTITSNLSLIHFNQNINGSNIFGMDGENIEWILKDAYINFFKSISIEIQKMEYSSFIKLWDNCCALAIENVAKILNDFALRHNFKLTKKQHELVRAKFLGNCGEIFAELYFTTGKVSSIVDPSVYQPVDPQHEQYSDASSIHVNTGLTVDIQVKNFLHALVERGVFVKTSDTNDAKIRGTSAIYKGEEALKYISTPHQIIFSTSNPETKMLEDEYFGRVIFIGPKEIDAAGFQGIPKKGIKGSYTFFEKIAEEIQKLK